MTTKDEAQPIDELLDVPREFHDVVRRYGRDLFQLVMDAGMAQHAVLVLAEVCQKHQSRGGLASLETLARAANSMKVALQQTKGWSDELCQECDRDLQLAFRTKIVVAKSPIILNS